VGVQLSEQVEGRLGGELVKYLDPEEQKQGNETGHSLSVLGPAAPRKIMPFGGPFR